MDSCGEHCEMHLISSLLRTAPNFLCKRWRTRLLRWESLFLIAHQKKARLQESNGSLKSIQNKMGERLRNIAHINTTQLYYVQKVLSINSFSCKLLKRNPEEGTGSREEQTPSNTVLWRLFGPLCHAQGPGATPCLPKLTISYSINRRNAYK